LKKLKKRRQAEGRQESSFFEKKKQKNFSPAGAGASPHNHNA
jgi:hypothetical protein